MRVNLNDLQKAFAYILTFKYAISMKPVKRSTTLPGLASPGDSLNVINAFVCKTDSHNNNHDIFITINMQDDLS